MDKYLNSFIEQLRGEEGEGFEVDEQAVSKAYEAKANVPTWPIIILSIFGGLVTATLFLSFLFLGGGLDNENFLLITGVVLVGVSIFGSTNDAPIFIRTLALSALITGLWLISLVLLEMEVGLIFISILFFGVGALLFLFIGDYIVKLTALFICLGSLLVFGVEIQSVFFVFTVYAVLFLSTILWSLNEAKIYYKFDKALLFYDPVRAFLFVSTLSFYLFSNNFIFNVSSWEKYAYLISMLSTAITLFFLFKSIIKRVEEVSNEHRLMLILFAFVLLVLSYFEADIVWSLSLALLAYFINYKFGLFLSLAAVLLNIIKYYYLLEVSLLYKSIILMVSGLVFLFLYYLLNKNMIDEKV